MPDSVALTVIPRNSKEASAAARVERAKRDEGWREILNFFKESELAQSVVATILIELLQNVYLGERKLQDTLFGFVLRERRVTTPLISDNLAFAMEAAIWTHYGMAGAEGLAKVFSEIKK